MKKGDLILVVSILALVLAVYGWMKLNVSENGGIKKIAVIKQGDRVIRRIDLDAVRPPERITIEGAYSNVVLVETGRIRFEDADCPDLVCVKTGWLTRNGDTAVCLPNRIVVKIEGENSEVDGVTY